MTFLSESYSPKEEAAVPPKGLWKREEGGATSVRTSAPEPWTLDTADWTSFGSNRARVFSSNI